MFDVADGAWLNTVEAATLLGVHKATIARWVKSGRLMPVRGEPSSGHERIAYLFRLEDIEAIKEG